MLNVLSTPRQLLAVGVTVMVAVTGEVPVLLAVKGTMESLPLAASPIEGSLFVHVYVVPVTGLPKFIVLLVSPLHKVIAAVESTVGVGFTIILKLESGPIQPLAVGVTVTVAVLAVVPVLVAVNERMSPVPLPDKPMDVLSFTQA